MWTVAVLEWFWFWTANIWIQVSLKTISYHRVTVSESFQFSRIARAFKGLIYSNSIQIFNLLRNHSCKYDTWSVTKGKRLFVKQTFHELNTRKNSRIYLSYCSKVSLLTALEYKVLESIFRFWKVFENWDFDS